jgi:hypothetical protein
MRAKAVTSRRIGTRDTKVLYSAISAFAESVGDGGGVRIFLESRDPPITHAEHVGEVTLPFPARGLDVPCIVPKRNDPIILGYEFS